MSERRGNYREVEDTVHTDLKGRMNYGDYLDLDRILNAQHLLTDEHDEMLFVIIHQASELWLKLAGHEVACAIRHVDNERYGQSFKVISRVKLIFNQLTQSWNILSTLTPVDYLKFRKKLGPASGLQSYEYRNMEFLLGNKNARLVELHRRDEGIYSKLRDTLEAPSLYDVVIRKLAQSGFDIDHDKLERDFTQPYEPNESVKQAWLTVYRNADTYFDFYELAEKLVDIEDAFQQWRFKHMYTVQRIIGTRMGTGGSSGVPFLRKALDISFFPELLDLRSDL
ncbi:MAG: tryptophan 2,3-dioxygenase family protein [Pseudomonadota bacterium]